MSSRTASYRRAAGVRLRPVPEMEFCLVFTAFDPNIYTLNAASWLILELCDGRSWRDVEAAYADAFARYIPVAQARRELRVAVDDLVAKKILERVATRSPASPQREGEARHERRQPA